MSVKLTIIQTSHESWERSIGYPEEGIQFEFSNAHEVQQYQDKVAVFVKKNSELFDAFNVSLNRVYHLGLERAGEVLAKVLEKTHLDTQQKTELLENVVDVLTKENFSKAREQTL